MKEAVILFALLLQRVPMKQLALLLAIFVLGAIGSLYHPFWAVLLYYLLAVLRPQFLWDWALPVEWRWSLFAGVILLMSLVLNLPRILPRLRLNAIACMIIAYGGWLVLSVVTAYDPITAANFGSDIAKVLVIALIATIMIDSLWQMHALGVMLLVTLGYIGWEINSLYLVQNRLDVFHYGYGGLDNNGAGLMLAMGLPFAFAYGVSAARRTHRLASWALGLLMLHALLMTYSRGAMLAAVVGAVWLLVHQRSRFQALMISLALGVSLAVLAGPEIRQRFVSTLEYETDGSAQSRLDSWAAAWRMAWDEPLTGKGIRNANDFSLNYGADRANRTIHSQYLQIAADSGIPAMLLFVAIVGLSFLRLQRSRRMCRDQLSDAGDGETPALAAELRAPIRRAEQLLLAFQASLLIYALGGVFLSLEVFELSWIVIVVAGAAPLVMERTLATLHGGVTPAPEHGPAGGADKPRFTPAPAIPYVQRGLPQT